jgi:hypothetical protein
MRLGIAERVDAAADQLTSNEQRAGDFTEAHGGGFRADRPQKRQGPQKQPMEEPQMNADRF